MKKLIMVSVEWGGNMVGRISNSFFFVYKLFLSFFTISSYCI